MCELYLLGVCWMFPTYRNFHTCYEIFILRAKIFLKNSQCVLLVLEKTELKCSKKILWSVKNQRKNELRIQVHVSFLKTNVCKSISE